MGGANDASGGAARSDDRADAARPGVREPDWLSADEARDAILSGVSPLPAERRALLDALGHVLAEDVASPLDLPPWDNSAMDGFAVRSADIEGASDDDPCELRVVDDIPAGGRPSRSLGPGEAARIMTGAPVPEGADGVVRVEHTDGGTGLPDSGGTGGSAAGPDRDDAAGAARVAARAEPRPDARVRIFSDADAGSNIRARGEDLRDGEIVLRAGTVLRAAEIGVLASVGRSRPSVVRRPTVAVLASGEELVDLDGFEEVIAGRRIVSTNSYTLAAQLAESGFRPRVLGIAKDSPESLREHLERARGCDALITTGGISVGAHDYTTDVLDELGLDLLFWRARIRPGSPLAFGRVGGLGGIPWFGLPGNPVSTMVTFEVFVRPALLRMAGHEAVLAPTVRARLAEDYSAKPGLTHFVRVRLARAVAGRGDADGAGATWTARLTGAQGSGILTSMSAADGLLVLPADRPDANAGELFDVIVLGGPLRSSGEMVERPRGGS